MPFSVVTQLPSPAAFSPAAFHPGIDMGNLVAGIATEAAGTIEVPMVSTTNADTQESTDDNAENGNRHANNDGEPYDDHEVVAPEVQLAEETAASPPTDDTNSDEPESTEEPVAQAAAAPQRGNNGAPARIQPCWLVLRSGERVLIGGDFEPTEDLIRRLYEDYPNADFAHLGMPRPRGN